MKPQPLTEAELDRVSALLERFDSKRSMNLEQLDGFFAALIGGPQIVPPSDYLPVICGDEMVLRDTVNAQPCCRISIFDHASLERHCRYFAFW